MDNAIGLFSVTPLWYFSSLLHPFSAGSLSAEPAAGALSLIAGIVLGSITRNSRLFYFLASFLLSQAFVSFAGFYRGQFMTGGEFVLYPFLLIQGALILYLVYRLNGVLIPAAFLSFFSITYAKFAFLVAAMSLSNTWL